MTVEKQHMYVGDKPASGYVKFGMETLYRNGQVYVAGMGSRIPYTIYIVHRLASYKGVHIAAELTHIEDMPDDGRSRRSPESADGVNNAAQDVEETRSAEPRIRHVSVYEARLILQQEEAPA